MKGVPTLALAAHLERLMRKGLSQRLTTIQEE